MESVPPFFDPEAHPFFANEDAMNLKPLDSKLISRISYSGLDRIFFENIDYPMSKSNFAEAEKILQEFEISQIYLQDLLGMTLFFIWKSISNSKHTFSGANNSQIENLENLYKLNELAYSNKNKKTLFINLSLTYQYENGKQRKREILNITDHSLIKVFLRSAKKEIIAKNNRKQKDIFIFSLLDFKSYLDEKGILTSPSKTGSNKQFQFISKWFDWSGVTTDNELRDNIYALRETFKRNKEKSKKD